MWPTMQGPRPCTHPLGSAMPTLSYKKGIPSFVSGKRLHHLEHTLAPCKFTLAIAEQPNTPKPVKSVPWTAAEAVPA